MDAKHKKTMFVRTMYIMVILAVALSMTTIAYAAPPSPFIGHWQAIDSDDESDIRLTIAGGGASPFHITWTESYFSFCEGKAGIVKGTGLLNPDDSNVLEANLHIKCFTTGASDNFQPVWIYDSGTDTITDGMNTWYRPG